MAWTDVGEVRRLVAVTPLGQLIEDCKRQFADAQGIELTNGDIARRGGLTRTRVQQLASDPIKAMPSATTLAGLAKGLAVSEDLVTLKALESTGYALPREYRLAARDVPGGPRGRQIRAEQDRQQETPPVAENEL